MLARLFCCCTKESLPQDEKIADKNLAVREQVSKFPNAALDLVKNRPEEFKGLDAETKLLIAQQLKKYKQISSLTDTKMQLLITQILGADKEVDHRRPTRPRSRC